MGGAQPGPDWHGAQGRGFGVLGAPSAGHEDQSTLFRKGQSEGAASRVGLPVGAAQQENFQGKHGKSWGCGGVGSAFYRANANVSGKTRHFPAKMGAGSSCRTEVFWL